MTGVRRLGKRAVLRIPFLKDVVIERDELRSRVGALGQALEATRGPTAPPRELPPTAAQRWFWDHYAWVVGQMADFLRDEGITLKGRTVADVGCGDGIVDLGVAHTLQPASLVAFDVVQTDALALLRGAAAEGVRAERLPDNLEFRVCEPGRLPAPDASFDVVFSWSAFEHIADPAAVLREMRRVVRPDGALFVQVWPFYDSQHGSHLQDWFPEGFVHHLREREWIESAVRATGTHDAAFTEHMLREFGRLNRITVDELQRHLRGARFRVTRVELLSEPFRVPAVLADRPLSLLGISGVKLIAVPDTS